MRTSCAAAAQCPGHRVATVDPCARLRVKEGMRCRRELRGLEGSQTVKTWARAENNFLSVSSQKMQMGQAEATQWMWMGSSAVARGPWSQVQRHGERTGEGRKRKLLRTG